MNRLRRLFAAFALLLIGSHTGLAEDRPGEFDYYTMALSWSPTYCATQGRSRPNEPQCSGDRPYSFVLHGLWPQYARGWPSDCENSKRPWVPEEVIDEMIDIMPSRQLIIRQYRKHGVCSGLSPKDYFRLSRQVFETITIPPRFTSPDDYLSLSPAEIKRAFLKANPALTPEMISIDCKDRNLRELRICFSRDLTPKPCGPNERQDRLCASKTIVMPPIRSGTYQYDEDYDEGEGSGWTD